MADCGRHRETPLAVGTMYFTARRWTLKPIVVPSQGHLLNDPRAYAQPAISEDRAESEVHNVGAKPKLMPRSPLEACCPVNENSGTQKEGVGSPQLDIQILY